MASSSSHSILYYDVFLSFRGSDTRKKFVSHLYKALENRGILTFKDDRELVKGDLITEEIRRAIRSSRFAVVVISKNYASSRWCLDELQLIMELHLGRELTVFPIFYGVEPSEVRHQKGCFADSFQKHEKTENVSNWREDFTQLFRTHKTPEKPEKVSKWREAFTRFAELSGVESTKCDDDAAMIEEIIEDISSRLPSTQPLDFSNIVGMTDQMEKISPLLEIDSLNTHMIGIWGMGGIGKTTIAKYLYEQHKRTFLPHYCFMESVAKLTREHGLVYLQEQLLSNIFREKNMKLEIIEQGRQQLEFRLRNLKVFLVLDDVDDVSQVDALAKYTNWFGRGSRIIITTRDRGLLKACRVDKVHEVKCLNDDHSLQMFGQVAFENGCPPSDGHKQLAVRASQLVQGLPSAIEACGLYLRGKTTIEEWESSLRRLERNPPRNIMTVLKLSYNGLAEPDKNVFLHIVFLFNGSTVRRVTSLLDDDELETKLGISILEDKSLISVSSDGYISMHILVEQMGREVVYLESETEPWRRRFLRNPRDISNVLSRGTGTEQIQGMTLHMCEMSTQLTISTHTSESMPNLKFLKFYKHLDVAKSTRTVGVENIFPDELRLLHWDACLLTALPPEPVTLSFQVRCLVEINLRYSNLERLGDILLPGFENLQRLDLTGSTKLQELSGLSTAKKLEELIISGCTLLTEIPESICRVPCLRKLNVGDLGGDITITDLEEGSRFRCPNQIRVKLPNTHLSLNYLTDLAIEGFILIDLLGLTGTAKGISFSSHRQIHDQLMTKPKKTARPHGFKSLNIKGFGYGYFVCGSFSQFLCLTELSLINLKITEIPSDIGYLQSLEKLDLSGNSFVLLPTVMGQQAKLKYLSLCNCSELESLPRLPQVERLALSECVNLPSLLEELPGLEKDSRSYQLLELCLDKCENVVEPSLSYGLSHFTNLTYLDLSSHDFKTLPSSIKDLSSLVSLCLNDCKKLKSIEKLPLSVKYLYAHGCDFLENVSLSSDHSIKHLDFSHCFSLKQIEKLMTSFLNNQHREVDSPRFACLPASRKSTYFNNQFPMIRGLNAWLAVASRIHLQFPSLSYTWKWKEYGHFYLTLKPDFDYPLKMTKEDGGTSYQLVFINIPISIVSEEAAVNLRLVASLHSEELEGHASLRSEELELQASIISSGVSFIRWP